MTTATAVKERPIIFGGPMVAAVLAGTKTQTRRVVKPAPGNSWYPEVGRYHPTVVDRHGDMYPGDEVFGASDEFEGRVCPYGKPGDRLWLREGHKVEPTPGCTFGDAIMGRKLSVFYRDGERRDIDNGWSASGPDLHVHGVHHDFPADRYGIWRPSIHMTRWASRILLEIVSVRVERLQDISEADAEAEGLARVGFTKMLHFPLFSVDPKADPDRHYHPSDDCTCYDSAYECYRALWDSINAKRGHGWDANCWVWVITFKVVTP